MTSERILYTLDLCRELDVCSAILYNNFTLVSTNLSEKNFWKIMAAEEREHVLFWQFTLDYSKKFTFPDIFQDVDKFIFDLEKSLKKVKLFLDDIKQNRNKLTSEYRIKSSLWMELYILRPEMEQIFEYFDRVSSYENNPGHNYDAHIFKFIERLKEASIDLNGLAIMGDTIYSLYLKNRELEKLNMHDFLTKVFSRRGFFKLAANLTEQAQRNKFPVGVLMIDIDNFRLINEKYGHDGGDQILAKTAHSVSENVRKSDIVGRYGGEEFIVLLNNPSKNAFYNVAEKVRKSVENAFCDDYAVTVSVGGAFGCLSELNCEKDFQNLIKLADNNLYESKKNGRNRVTL